MLAEKKGPLVKNLPELNDVEYKVEGEQSSIGTLYD